MTVTTTMNTLTLGELAERTGRDVLGHLEREVSVPVVDGLQAQGDLLVVPLALVPHVTESRFTDWNEVPPEGVELLRGEAGGNPHALVADVGTCWWNRLVSDPTGLAVGMFEASATVYLIHPEHGASGIAPGRYVVRRQRERGTNPSPWRTANLPVRD